MAKNISTYAKLLADIPVAELDDFVNLLKEDGVLLQAEAIIAAAEKIINRREFNKTITVHSAEKLDSELKHTLVKKLKSIIEAPIVKEITNESLLAGVKIELPNGVIDGSLLGRLDNLSALLKS